MANGYISYARFRVLSASGECTSMPLHLDTWEAHLGSFTSDSRMSARSKSIYEKNFPGKWRSGVFQRRSLWVNLSRFFKYLSEVFLFSNVAVYRTFSLVLSAEHLR